MAKLFWLIEIFCCCRSVIIHIKFPKTRSKAGFGLWCFSDMDPKKSYGSDRVRIYSPRLKMIWFNVIFLYTELLFSCSIRTCTALARTALVSRGSTIPSQRSRAATQAALPTGNSYSLAGFRRVLALTAAGWSLVSVGRQVGSECRSLE